MNRTREFAHLIIVAIVARFHHPARQQRFVGTMDIMARGAVHHLYGLFSKRAVTAPLQIGHRAFVAGFAHRVDRTRRRWQSQTVRQMTVDAPGTVLSRGRGGGMNTRIIRGGLTGVAPPAGVFGGSFIEMTHRVRVSVDTVTTRTIR